MVEFGFEDDAAEIRCEGCGETIPAFLDGCPYCDQGADEEETETWPCPSCGGLIHPDAQKCSLCGDWVTPRLQIDAERRRRTLIIVLLLVVALISTYLLLG